MGCIIPAKQISNQNQPDNSAERDIRFLFSSIGLDKKDLDNFKKLFSKLKLNEVVDTICLSDFMKSINVPYTFIVYELFSVSIRGDSSKGSFLLRLKDFIFVVWNFCTLEYAELVTYIFATYDKKAKGFLDVSALKLIVRDIHVTESNEMNDTLRSQLGIVEDINEFAVYRKDTVETFFRDNKSCLAPLLESQKAMRQAVFGLIYWEEKIRSRSKLSPGRVIELQDQLYGNRRPSRWCEDIDATDDLQNGNFPISPTSPIGDRVVAFDLNAVPYTPPGSRVHNTHDDASVTSDGIRPAAIGSPPRRASATVSVTSDSAAHTAGPTSVVSRATSVTVKARYDSSVVEAFDNAGDAVGQEVISKPEEVTSAISASSVSDTVLPAVLQALSLPSTIQSTFYGRTSSTTATTNTNTATTSATSSTGHATPITIDTNDSYISNTSELNNPGIATSGNNSRMGVGITNSISVFNSNSKRINSNDMTAEDVTDMLSPVQEYQSNLVSTYKAADTTPTLPPKGRNRTSKASILVASTSNGTSMPRISSQPNFSNSATNGSITSLHMSVNNSSRSSDISAAVNSAVAASAIVPLGDSIPTTILLPSPPIGTGNGGSIMPLTAVPRKTFLPPIDATNTTSEAKKKRQHKSKHKSADLTPDAAPKDDFLKGLFSTSANKSKQDTTTQSTESCKGVDDCDGEADMVVPFSAECLSPGRT